MLVSIDKAYANRPSAWAWLIVWCWPANLNRRTNKKFIMLVCRSSERWWRKVRKELSFFWNVSIGNGRYNVVILPLVPRGDFQHDHDRHSGGLDFWAPLVFSDTKFHCWLVWFRWLFVTDRHHQRYLLTKQISRRVHQDRQQDGRHPDWWFEKWGSQHS